MLSKTAFPVLLVRGKLSLPSDPVELSTFHSRAQTRDGSRDGFMPSPYVVPRFHPRYLSPAPSLEPRSHLQLIRSESGLTQGTQGNYTGSISV